MRPCSWNFSCLFLDFSIALLAGPYWLLSSGRNRAVSPFCWAISFITMAVLTVAFWHGRTPSPGAHSWGSPRTCHSRSRPCPASASWGSPASHQWMFGTGELDEIFHQRRADQCNVWIYSDGKRKIKYIKKCLIISFTLGNLQHLCS